MVVKRVCTFCGEEIEPGTGMMYIKKDGTVYHFCSSKCRKNLLHLKREPRKVRWSQYSRE
ncbi:MAG: 50S ribosomal protein L24e [Thermoplasmata archaeon]|nr:MAG: 50S ribosomal protein L24e [Thermoplasmata archaeon]